TLFPDQSAAWYGATIALHFVNAILGFWLADTLLRGTRRWIALAAALLFAFHMLQINDYFEYPTGGLRHTSFALALLSLGLYLRYVRGFRRSRWQREVSMALFCVAVAMYEQTALFVLLHPVIAYFEDRHNHTIGRWREWLTQVALDSFWYGAFVIAYLLVLSILFPSVTSARTGFSFDRTAEQVLGALALEYNPSELWERAAPALQGGGLLLTNALVVVVFVGFFVRRFETADKPRAASEPLLYLIVFGISLTAATLLGVGVVNLETLVYSPRIIYPSALGFAFLITGVLGYFAERLTARRIGQALFALVVALLVGTGITRLIQTQQQYLAKETIRSDVMNAIHTVVPSWEGDPPYFLIVPGEAHYSELIYGMHARDANFSMMFERMYGVEGVKADLMYLGLLANFAPAENESAEDYVGPYIIVDEQGIWSPLRPFTPWPYTPADPERMIIIAYDFETKTATVLDELPLEELVRGNIVQRVPIEWRTNVNIGGGS
ncbi:MAG: hypothetical protein H7175_20380, partial [Burkholderiales bacterium]|nr:hypothetical protein [Anaerolineae bacterium]